jgi:exodeoxyribonuclease VII large subunit
MEATGSAIRMAFPTEIWVQAQIVAVRPMRWGSVLDLIDDQADNTATCARVSCNAGHDVFARIHQQTGLEVDPAALVGTCALLRVKVGFHARYQMSLRLTGIDPSLAAGLLERQIDLTRKALVGEGIFDAQHRLPAPPDVTRLVVIHPDQSASWSDVEAELRRWEGCGILEVTSLAATFEGPNAAASLVKALRQARDLALAGNASVVAISGAAAMPRVSPRFPTNGSRAVS